MYVIGHACNVYAGCPQIERLQKAADDARQQLDSKENIVKELSRDGSKLDKERSDTSVLFLCTNCTSARLGRLLIPSSAQHRHGQLIVV